MKKTIETSIELYISKRSHTVTLLPPSYCTLPIVFYAVSATGNLLLLLPDRGPSVASDPTGGKWEVASITVVTALVSIFVMGAFAAIAWARLRDWNSTS